MNKLTIGLILSAIILFTNTAFCQNFDINNYKFRYQKYRGFTNGIDLNSNGAQELSNITNNISEEQFFINDFTNRANLNISSRLFTFINTDKLQRTSQLQVDDDFSYSNRTIDDVKASKNISKNISNTFRVNYRDLNRIYDGNRFKYFNFQLGLSQNNVSFHNQNGNSNLTDQKSLSRYTNGNIQIGLGKGRLEYVSDIILARFILDDLSINSSESFTNEQLVELAKGLTLINNQRYLDYRIGLKKQLSLLDSVMVKNNIKANDIVSYFTTLNDNWLYANRVGRFTGSRWTTFVELGSNLEQIKLDAESKNLQTLSSYFNFRDFFNEFYNTGIGVEFEKSHQKSLHVQKSFGASLKSQIRFETYHSELYAGTDPNPDIELTTTRHDDLEYQLSAFWQHLYQPNSRNVLIARVSPNVLHSNQIKLREDSEDAVNDLQLNLDLAFSYYKWLSPQLWLDLSANLSVTNSDIHSKNIVIDQDGNYTNIYHNVRFRINYQLF